MFIMYPSSEISKPKLKPNMKPEKYVINIIGTPKSGRNVYDNKKNKIINSSC